MILTLKFQSFSDMITNSSSELFTIANSDYSAKELEVLLQNLPESHDSSGMAGIITVRDWQDIYDIYLENYIPANKRDQVTPEIWALNYEESLDDLKKMLWIDIDHNYKDIINWILENLWVIDVDRYGFRKDPKTGRVIEFVGYQKWRELPEDEAYN